MSSAAFSYIIDLYNEKKILYGNQEKLPVIDFGWVQIMYEKENTQNHVIL